MQPLRRNTKKRTSQHGVQTHTLSRLHVMEAISNQRGEEDTRQQTLGRACKEREVTVFCRARAVRGATFAPAKHTPVARGVKRIGRRADREKHIQMQKTSLKHARYM